MHKHHAHAHVHTNTHVHALTHYLSHTHTLSLSHTNTHTHSLSLSLSLSLSQTHTHTHTYTQTHTHTHKHTPPSVHAYQICAVYLHHTLSATYATSLQWPSYMNNVLTLIELLAGFPDSAGGVLLPLVEPVLQVLRSSAEDFKTSSMDSRDRVKDSGLADGSHLQGRSCTPERGHAKGRSQSEATEGRANSEEDPAQLIRLPCAFYAASIAMRLSTYAEPAAALVQVRLPLCMWLECITDFHMSCVFRCVYCPPSAPAFKMRGKAFFGV